MQKFILTVLMAVGITACAGSVATAPQRLTLIGEIHIKGNEPFPTVMLETRSHQTWELISMPLTAARSLVGRESIVEGVVEREPGPGVWLPSMRVQGEARPSGR